MQTDENGTPKPQENDQISSSEEQLSAVDASSEIMSEDILDAPSEPLRLTDESLTEPNDAPYLSAKDELESLSEELLANNEEDIEDIIVATHDVTEDVTEEPLENIKEESVPDSNIRVEPIFMLEETKAEENLAEVQPSPRVKSISRRDSKRDAKRLAHYADIRREQFEEFNALLETLTRVDDLLDTQMEQVRDAVFHADHPFLLTLVGPFSAGKSSVINALLGDAVMDVGPIPTTDNIAILRYGPTVQKTRTGETSTIFYPSELLRGLSLVDTPGLESVFKSHDQLTLKFLHRADIVILVMLATQVLTAHDLAFVRDLRQVGKRLIIAVNQIDVLEEVDRQRVYDFVREQSRIQLGFEPLIWLISAKQALKAYETEPRDEIIWDESGFAEIEEYLEESLDDAERVRQKLETPLLVAQTATRSALDNVREAQSSLTEHRKTVDNIKAQIEASEKDRHKLYEKMQGDIDAEWDNAIKGGEEAIDDLFQFSRTLGQTLGGVVEIIGIGAFFRRFRRQTKAQEAFGEYKVREAMDRIAPLANKIGPALEGRDLEDIDGLVDYTRQQMNDLPERLQNKFIGKVQTPMSYDRKALRDIRGELDDVLREASQFETTRIDRSLRSVMMVMALWEFLVILLAVMIGSGSIETSGNIIVTVIFFLGLALLGLLLMPVRGWYLQRSYRQRMKDLQSRYDEKLDRAARQQLEYGTQLRRDVVAPFTRLIETQTEINDNLKSELERHDQKITSIQHSLSALLKS